jgi:hypothetical protein
MQEVLDGGAADRAESANGITEWHALYTVIK